MVIRLLAVLVMLGAAAPAAVFNFYSGFNTPGDTEGWTIMNYCTFSGCVQPGGTGPVQVGSGGVAGGYLQATDTNPGFLLFVAPSSWSGNRYGATLSFNLRNENPANYSTYSSAVLPQPVVWVSDGTTDLFALWGYLSSPSGGNLPGVNGTNWTYNQITLDSSYPYWSLSPSSVVAPGSAVVASVLSNMTQMGILGDWVSNFTGAPVCNSPSGNCTDITGLDEVRLYGGEIPEPGTMGLLAAGLATLAVWRRQAR